MIRAPKIRHLLHHGSDGLDYVEDTPFALDLRTMTVHRLDTDEFAVLKGQGIDLATMMNLTPKELAMLCEGHWESDEDD